MVLGLLFSELEIFLECFPVIYRGNVNIFLTQADLTPPRMRGSTIVLPRIWGIVFLESLDRYI